MSDYEIFEKKQSRVGRPSVTINPVGRIYFNQEATEWLVAHKVKRVLLLWSAEEWMVGLRKAKQSDTRAYSLAYNNRGGGSSLTAKSFLNWIGFKSDNPLLTVDAELSDDLTLLEFDIPGEYLEHE